MPILIRPGQKKDLNQIIELLSSSSQADSDQKKTLKYYKRLLVLGIYHLLVAELDGKIVGTASIIIFPSIQHQRPWGLIDNVAVIEQYQKKGIGRQLGQRLEKLALKSDCYKVILTSRKTRPGTHQFWEKLGFIKHGFSFRKDFSKR